MSYPSENTLKLWDLVSGKELRNLKGHLGGLYSVVIAPDGQTALSGSWDKTLKLWDLETGKVLRTFIGHSGGVSGVFIASDARTAFSGSDDLSLKLWDLASGKELRTFAGIVRGFDIAPDGERAFVAER